MSRRLRRTKIVTTLGPATDRDNNLEKVIAAGANVVRMNFSHGTPEDHQLRADKVREIAAKLGRHVAILGDLQGPKIRVSTFKEGKIFLNVGDKFLLDANLGKGEGDKEKVGIDYKGLPADVVPGDILLLDDGRVQLKVLEVQGMKVFTEVTVGGPLSNNKGINKLGGGLSAEALTDKDKADIVTAAKIGVDYLAVSFPRCGEDLNYARRLARDAGCDAKIVAKVESLAEFNPMLGHRGCRLGNTYPEITEMQARAIIEAAMNVKAQGIPVHVEIMVPLVGNHKELRYQKGIIDATAEQVFSERNDKIDYMVGTMIEVPRAAVTANQIAEVAEFFSFGTNDLTQMTLGFSRDDIGKFLPIYLDKGILKNDPFQILDQNGVGQLIREAVFKGRGKRPMLKCGICGEHGGEPSSVEFCHYAGLNYVSCSPFRVPIARLAAAHAALKEK